MWASYCIVDCSPCCWFLKCYWFPFLQSLHLHDYKWNPLPVNNALKMNDYQSMNQTSLQCQKCHGSTWPSTHHFLIMSLYPAWGRSYRRGKLLTVTISLFFISHSLDSHRERLHGLKMNNLHLYQSESSINIPVFNKCHLSLEVYFQENNTIDTGEVDVGRRAVQDVPPGTFWRTQLFIDQPQSLKFNISVQRGALVGVYGRKGLPPTHTQVLKTFFVPV